MGHFSIAPILCALTILIAHSGCEDRATEQLKPVGGQSKASEVSSADRSEAIGAHDSGVRGDSELFESRQNQPFDSSPLKLAGKMDTKNRYSSTVMVSPHVRESSADTKEQEKLRCSGVLVGQRHILTTGHCLCPDIPPCHKAALVTTVAYSPDESGQFITSTEEYLGEVKFHPNLVLIPDNQGNTIKENFSLLLDSQGKILKENTDLAIIFLDKPVSKGFTPLMPAKTGLLAGESTLVVGYGHDKNKSGVYGQRRFKEHKVLRLQEAGKWIILEQPNRETYKGDSGGPCLHETEQSTELVGISTRGIGKEAACISLNVYRSWIDDTIKGDLGKLSP